MIEGPYVITDEQKSRRRRTDFTCERCNNPAVRDKVKSRFGREVRAGLITHTIENATWLVQEGDVTGVHASFWTIDGTRVNACEIYPWIVVSEKMAAARGFLLTRLHLRKSSTQSIN